MLSVVDEIGDETCCPLQSCFLKSTVEHLSWMLLAVGCSYRSIEQAKMKTCRCSLQHQAHSEAYHMAVFLQLHCWQQWMPACRQIGEGWCRSTDGSAGEHLLTLLVPFWTAIWRYECVMYSYLLWVAWRRLASCHTAMGLQAGPFKAAVYWQWLQMKKVLSDRCEPCWRHALCSLEKPLMMRSHGTILIIVNQTIDWDAGLLTRD